MSAALGRAEQLVKTASTRLEAQDEHIESLYGLVECLVGLGPPMAVVEGQTVRAWSPALETLTGVRANTAVGALLDRVLPSLDLVEPGPWHWTDRGGSHWAVDVCRAGPQLRVLHWTERVDATEGAVAVSA